MEVGLGVRDWVAKGHSRLGHGMLSRPEKWAMISDGIVSN